MDALPDFIHGVSDPEFSADENLFSRFFRRHEVHPERYDAEARVMYIIRILFVHANHLVRHHVLQLRRRHALGLGACIHTYMHACGRR